MTGPDHYYRAEEILNSIAEWEVTDEAIAGAAVMAQAHATLALVAATIDAAEVDSYADGGLQHVASPSEIRNWREVTS